MADIEVTYRKPDYRPAFIFDDVEELVIRALRAQRFEGAEPTIVLKDVRKALLKDGNPFGADPAYLRREGTCEKIIDYIHSFNPT
jgi:hypothetical protein